MSVSALEPCFVKHMIYERCTILQHAQGTLFIPAAISESTVHAVFEPFVVSGLSYRCSVIMYSDTCTAQMISLRFA